MLISYRFSDIPIHDLKKLIDPVYNLIKDKGVDVFCNFYYEDHYLEQGYTGKQVMDHCFENIDKKEIILCLVDTPKYSCGMLLEMGYSLAQKKKIVVCFREGCEIDTLNQMADHSIIYKDYDDLLEKIDNYFI